MLTPPQAQHTTGNPYQETNTNNNREVNNKQKQILHNNARATRCVHERPAKTYDGRLTVAVAKEDTVITFSLLLRRLFLKSFKSLRVHKEAGTISGMGGKEAENIPQEFCH